MLTPRRLPSRRLEPTSSCQTPAVDGADRRRRQPKPVRSLAAGQHVTRKRHLFCDAKNMNSHYTSTDASGKGTMRPASYTNESSQLNPCPVPGALRVRLHSRTLSEPNGNRRPATGKRAPGFPATRADERVCPKYPTIDTDRERTRRHEIFL